MPNCEETTYTATVSAAPFRRCDFRTLGMHPLCNPARLDDNAGSFGRVDPPFWGTSTLNQYRQAFHKTKYQVFMSSTISFSGTELPNYITDRVHANERKYAGTNQVYTLVQRLRVI